MDLSFECCTSCPTESALETVDLSDNGLGGRAPNWLAGMLKGTIKTLNLTGNLLTGDYKALDNLATGFVRANTAAVIVDVRLQQCASGNYRKVDQQLNLGTCELTPPVKAELVVQSKESFIEVLQKPSTPATGKSLTLVLNVNGGSAFAPQYTATISRLGSAQPISSRAFTSLDEPRLSLDGLHAEWQGNAPSGDAAVELSATAGKFSETKVYQLVIYADCTGTQPCAADGDTIDTVLTIGNASSPEGQRSQVLVSARIQAVPSCSRSTAALVASAGQVDPSTESVRLEAQLLDVDALPITVSSPKVIVVWANKTFPLERTVAGSSRFSWEIPASLRREPGRYAYNVLVEEAWDEVERAKARCSLLEGTLYVGKGFDTTWVLVGSILGAIVLIGTALFLVRRHQEMLMVIVVMLVTEIVKLGFSLGLEIGDIVTE